MHPCTTGRDARPWPGRCRPRPEMNPLGPRDDRLQPTIDSKRARIFPVAPQRDEVGVLAGGDEVLPIEVGESSADLVGAAAVEPAVTSGPACMPTAASSWVQAAMRPCWARDPRRHVGSCAACPRADVHQTVSSATQPRLGRAPTALGVASSSPARSTCETPQTRGFVVSIENAPGAFGNAGNARPIGRPRLHRHSSPLEQCRYGTGSIVAPATPRPMAERAAPEA